MWWAGWSAPARFANPAVPILAIPCAVAWSRMRNRGSRAVAAGSLAFTAFLSAVLVLTDGGRLAYNTRETTALWLDWASTLAPLADGIPIWFRGLEAVFARDIAVWVVAFALAWWGARALAGVPRFRNRGYLLTAVTALHLAAAMLAATVVWRMHGSNRLLAASSELDLLRAFARAPRALAVQVTPPRVLTPVQPARAPDNRAFGGAPGWLARPQRSDDCRAAGDSRRPLPDRSRRGRFWWLADDRNRARSARTAQRADRLAGSADRDRVSG